MTKVYRKREKLSGSDNITTFFNGACPVCSTEIKHYKKISRRQGLGLLWCDVAKDESALSAYGIDQDKATRRLYVIDREGQLHGGVDAFVVLWSALPRYRWLARLASQPLVKPLAGWVYENLLAWPLYLWNRRRLAHR